MGSIAFSLIQQKNFFWEFYFMKLLNTLHLFFNSGYFSINPSLFSLDTKIIFLWSLSIVQLRLVQLSVGYPIQRRNYFKTHVTWPQPTSLTLFWTTFFAITETLTFCFRNTIGLSLSTIICTDVSLCLKWTFPVFSVLKN